MSSFDEIAHCRCCGNPVAVEESFAFPSGGRDCVPCWRVTRMEAAMRLTPMGRYFEHLMTSHEAAQILAWGTQ